MATPLRRPINEEFSDRYDRNTGFESSVEKATPAANTNRGIQNTSVITYEKRSPTVPSRAQKLRQPRRERILNTPEAANLPSRPTLPAPAQMRRLISYGSMLISSIWASFLSVIATILGMMILAGIGGIVAIEATIGTGVLSSLTSFFTERWYGFTRADIYGFFYIFITLYYVLIFVMFWSCYKIMSFAGAKPLAGQMMAFKFTTFMLAVVIALIPGGTFVPLIGIWLWFVAHYPN